MKEDKYPIISALAKEMDSFLKEVFAKKSTKPETISLQSLKTMYELDFLSFPTWKKNLYRFLQKFNVLLFICILLLIVAILFS